MAAVDPPEVDPDCTLTAGSALTCLAVARAEDVLLGGAVDGRLSIFDLSTAHARRSRRGGEGHAIGAFDTTANQGSRQRRENP
mgnify:CR=1 FL=1